MKTLAHFCALALGMLLCGTANAVVILTLDNDGTPSFQQQLSSPCVIGSSSCNNPPGFGFNDINPDDNDNTVTFAESTQSYLVSQVLAIVGATFDIGIDTNQSGNSSNVNNWLKLQTFDVLITRPIVGTVGEFKYDVAAPGTPINLTNGGGFSDAVLSQVNLSTFLPTDTITFQALYNNATNGPESFFIFSTPAPPCTVNCGPPEGQAPEPGTLILLGSALAALGGFTRRKARTSVES